MGAVRCLVAVNLVTDLEGAVVIDNPTFTRVRVLVLVTAAALGLGMLVGHSQRGPLSLGAVLQVLVGWSFVACGVFLWARRPANRLGPLMALVGMLWLLGRTLLFVQVPIVFTAGMWLSDLWAVGFALFLLSFPSGRLHSRVDVAIVGVFLFAQGPLELLWLLFLELENGLNALALAPNANAASVVDFIQRFMTSLGAVLIVITLGRRWLRSSGPGRRQLLPVIAGAIAMLLLSAAWILEPVGMSPALLVDLGLLAQVAIPMAVIVVILRARLARGAIADLVVELGQTPTPARLRDALANALGDPSLQVAYWAPEHGRFVDAAGEEQQLPEDNTGQAVTMLERDGMPEAAIIHDAILLEEPGLIASVASALRLAVENDRLTAAVEAQLSEVRASRARIVAAGDAERRRIERDLHDGAQQRLVSLSLALRLARSKLGETGDPAVRESLDRAAGEASAALEELRDLALGIHPLILTEGGLEPAVESLADRMAVDVSVEVEGARYSPEVEGTAYFVISEALANVSKYANASAALVRVNRDGDRLRIEVSDDGVGGADPDAGSGLSGLADRLAAIGGTITVVSPVGGGTRVTADFPAKPPTVVPVPAL